MSLGRVEAQTNQGCDMPNRRKSQVQITHGASAEEWAEVHQQLRDDKALWANLQFQGISGQPGGPVHEMRGCPVCGTTVYREVALIDAVSVLSDYCGVVQRSLAMIPALLTLPAAGRVSSEASSTA